MPTLPFSNRENNHLYESQFSHLSKKKNKFLAEPGQGLLNQVSPERITVLIQYIVPILLIFFLKSNSFYLSSSFQIYQEIRLIKIFLLILSFLQNPVAICR